MPLIDLRNSSASPDFGQPFTDVAGNSVSITSGPSHESGSGTNGYQVKNFGDSDVINDTLTYEFSGSGVTGLAVMISAPELDDTYIFTINGTVVNLQDMIDAGEAQIVHPDQLPANVNIQSHLNNIGGVDSNGNLSGDNGSGSDIYGNTGNSTPIISFNIPITSLSVTSVNGDDALDLFLDTNATNGVVCFTHDTLIDTDQGEVAVQDLTEGMMVRTRDNGMQPIRWIGSTKRAAVGKLAPIKIAAGTLGNTRDLRVSPQHRMVLDGWRAELLFGETEVLAPAKALINDQTIVRDEGGQVEYFHILFDQHEIIFAEGAASESFHPGEEGWSALDAATRSEILELFPELETGFEGYGPSARMSLKAYETAVLAEFLS